MSSQLDALYQGLNNLSHFTLFCLFKQKQAKDCTLTSELKLHLVLVSVFQTNLVLLCSLSDNLYTVTVCINLLYDYLNMSFFGVDFIMCYKCQKLRHLIKITMQIELPKKIKLETVNLELILTFCFGRFGLPFSKKRGKDIYHLIL